MVSTCFLVWEASLIWETETVKERPLERYTVQHNNCTTKMKLIIITVQRLKCYEFGCTVHEWQDIARYFEFENIVNIVNSRLSLKWEKEVKILRTWIFTFQVVEAYKNLQKENEKLQVQILSWNCSRYICFVCKFCL